MQNVGRKVMGTVISAVLLLYMAFPISDFQKPERAYANPGVLVIFGTAAAAGGLLIGGATLAQYNVNLESVAQGFENATSQWSASWSQYVQDQGSFSNAMNSCVTASGTINLETLKDAGFFDSLHSYSAYCVQQGTMATGTNSYRAGVNVLTVGSDNYAIVNAPSDAVSWSQNYWSSVQGKYVHAWRYDKHENGDVFITLYYGNTQSRTTLTVGDHYLTWTSAYAHTLKKDSQSGFVSYGAHSSVNTTINVYGNHGQNGSITYDYLVEGITYNVSGAVNGTVPDDMVAVASPDLVAGNATAPTSTVQPFEPTAEQLSSGYTSADIVDAINSGNAQTNASLDSILSAITTTLGGVLNDIKTGVNGLETTIGAAVSGALGSVLSGIQTTVGTVSTTLGDIWGGVQGWYTDWLAWVGATPLGQLIAQIIAALQDGVISLSQAIAAVQTAVQTAVTDLVGAIESIQIPTFELPTVTLPYANLNGGSGTADLMDGSAAHVSAFQSFLNDKEPFCYLFAFSNGMQQVQANNSAARFRIQHRFDIMGQPLDVDINAEPYLLRDVGGTTIADLLRSSMTLTLCMGLLYSAYRTALRAVKS